MRLTGMSDYGLSLGYPEWEQHDTAILCTSCLLPIQPGQLYSSGREHFRCFPCAMLPDEPYYADDDPDRLRPRNWNETLTDTYYWGRTP